MSILEAVKSRDVAQVRSALGTPRAVNERSALGESPLHLAARLGPGEIVTLLLEAGARPDQPQVRKQTPLHYAAAVGNAESVSLLLAAGADGAASDTFGQTALHSLANGGVTASPASRLATAQALVAAGAEVNAPDNSGRTPLWYASNRGHVEVVRLLLSLGGDPHQRARGTQGSPIDAALAAGHAEIATLLQGE